MVKKVKYHQYYFLSFFIIILCFPHNSQTVCWCWYENLLVKVLCAKIQEEKKTTELSCAVIILYKNLKCLNVNF